MLCPLMSSDFLLIKFKPKVKIDKRLYCIHNTRNCPSTFCIATPIFTSGLLFRNGITSPTINPTSLSAIKSDDDYKMMMMRWHSSADCTHGQTPPPPPALWLAGASAARVPARPRDLRPPPRRGPGPGGRVRGGRGAATPAASRPLAH